MKRLAKVLIRLFLGLGILYLILLIPLPESTPPATQVSSPFLWDQDETWHYLEARFLEARQQDVEKLDSTIATLMLQAEAYFDGIKEQSFRPQDSVFSKLEAHFFAVGPYVAARPIYSQRLIDHYSKVRNWSKAQSQAWDMNDRPARNTLYRILYGMRAAVEEVLLQTEGMDFPPAMLVKEEYAATPSIDILGIKVHSGDLLVSRGGAAASAFISRGNDYPGNFSHVSILYIDAASNTPYLVEAHIEKGVAASSLDQYLKDQKLRFMVLRPRADLPAIQADPQLPQKAAKLAFEESKSRHIPYDFKMNFHDSTSMFCSEVGSYAYRKNGVQLWQGLSTISSEGVVDWLYTFGVEHFVTQMPSDLEYDPQLSVVGEWRDPETLYRDHIDNAVMDAIWLAADAGKEINHNPFHLPLARLLKAYCFTQNLFGKAGMIPEGMNARQALKNNAFAEKFAAIKEETEKAAVTFQATEGYVPPFWQLVKMAEEAEQRLGLFE